MEVKENIILKVLLEYNTLEIIYSKHFFIEKSSGKFPMG